MVTRARAATVAGMTVAGFAAGMGLRGSPVAASLAGGAALALWTVAVWCASGRRGRAWMRAAGVTFAAVFLPLFWSVAAAGGWLTGDWETGVCLSGVAVLLWAWCWRTVRDVWRPEPEPEPVPEAQWTGLEELIVKGDVPLALIWLLRDTKPEGKR